MHPGTEMVNAIDELERTMRLTKRTPQAKAKRTAKRAGKTASALSVKTKGLVLAGVGAAVAAIALLGSKRGRHAVKGAAAGATSPVRQSGRDYDDVTLARKVESEILGREGDDIPKGAISVNAQHGTVELRGQVKRPDQIEALGKAAGKVSGVENVHNLLHTAGSEPKHSPVSEPDEVRDRAAND
jgi:osmotically-inducible protein OsmY